MKDMSAWWDGGTLREDEKGVAFSVLRPLSSVLLSVSPLSRTVREGDARCEIPDGECGVVECEMAC